MLYTDWGVMVMEGWDIGRQRILHVELLEPIQEPRQQGVVGVGVCGIHTTTEARGARGWLSYECLLQPWHLFPLLYATPDTTQSTSLCVWSAQWVLIAPQLGSLQPPNVLLVPTVQPLQARLRAPLENTAPWGPLLRMCAQRGATVRPLQARWHALLGAIVYPLA